MPFVQVCGDILNQNAVRAVGKYLAHKCGFVLYDRPFLIDYLIAENDGRARVVSFDTAFVQTAFHFCCQFRAVKLVVALDDTLEHDPFGRVRNLFRCGYDLNAVVSQCAFMYRAVVAVTRKAVELIDDNVIELAVKAVGNHTLKVWAVVVSARHRAVYVRFDNVVALLLGKFGYDAQLSLDTLLVLAGGGVTGVYDGVFSVIRRSRFRLCITRHNPPPGPYCGKPL